MCSDHFEIEGRWIETEIEFWSGQYYAIGCSSCSKEPSSLKMGYQFHLGDFAFINTARAVKVGKEAGLGRISRAYAHSLYPSFLDRFSAEFGPMTSEDRISCPKCHNYAERNKGHDTVAGADAVARKSLPFGALFSVSQQKSSEKTVSQRIHHARKSKMMTNFAIHFVTHNPYFGFITVLIINNHPTKTTSVH